MQDVFPINFDFVKGEQPSGTKLTGWIKQTDVAFSRIGKAIGDPWDTQAHAAGLTSVLLSPQRLGQPSLARSLGPVDWVSPQGASWNQAVTSTFKAVLYPNRNTWSLGYPLVKVTTDIDTSPTISSHVTPLVWNTDIEPVTDATGVFGTERTTLEAVVQHGDFHINYYTGVITVFTPPLQGVELNISNIHMFGPGVPWGTANIIPTWDQSTLCTVEENDGSPSGGLSTYTITFPPVDTGTRVNGGLTGANTPYGDGAASFRSDVAYLLSCPGKTAYYRLPYAITSAFSADDAIPEGYMYIWDHATARVIQSLVTFYYIDENSIKAVTPQGWLTEGDTVRIIVPGTSVAEAVGYLLSATRDNRHVGLAEGADGKTLAYTSPISHDHLADLYVGNLDNLETDREKFEFRKSSYPINPHPQYLHRAGYMADDATGNSANAMRGDLVLASSDSDFTLGNTYEATYAIMFGGGLRTGNNGNSRFAFEGGEVIDTWSSGVAHRFPFGIPEVSTILGGAYGAVTYTPWRGTPLYLRGKDGETTSIDYAGAVLGFDLGRNAELNNIRLMSACRSGVEDYPNLPVRTSSNNSVFSSPLPCTDGDLSNRLSPEQIREFRFRGIPYCDNALNTGDSLGNLSSESEFNEYFTSPGVVGADFFNVYSNAIFFSDTGDGELTSFTSRGTTWMNSANSDANLPTGIYYNPASLLPHYKFALFRSSAATAPFSVGDHYGFVYDSQNAGPISLSTTGIAGVYADGVIDIVSQDDLTLRATDIAKMETTASGGSYYARVEVLAAASTPTARLVADTHGGASPNYIECNSDLIDITSRGNINFYSYTDTYQFSDIPDVSGGEDLLYINGNDHLRKAVSSRKYKTNIAALEDIGWLYNLRPCSFSFKKNLNKTNYGLIAEEVYEHDRNVVTLDPEGNARGVAYLDLVSVLVKAVQDQKEEIDSLKAESTWLKAELDKKSNKRVYKKKKK
jgi:hypothetical protein